MKIKKILFLPLLLSDLMTGCGVKESYVRKTVMSFSDFNPSLLTVELKNIKAIECGKYLSGLNYSLNTFHTYYKSSSQNDIDSAYDFLKNTKLYPTNDGIAPGCSATSITLVLDEEGPVPNIPKKISIHICDDIFQYGPNFYKAENKATTYGSYYGYGFSYNVTCLMKVKDETGEDVTNDFRSLRLFDYAIFEEISNPSFDTEINEFNKYCFEVNSGLGSIRFETNNAFTIISKEGSRSYRIVNEITFDILKSEIQYIGSIYI